MLQVRVRPLPITGADAVNVGNLHLTTVPVYFLSSFVMMLKQNRTGCLYF
ncbi:hypothetical protein [Steroidobacter denitrificans]|nr:hypothetical protein [Steroidobacter denitrificans]